MKEIPITLEASNSKLLMECTNIDETRDSEQSAQNMDDDLLILADDASMPVAVIGMGFRGPGDATNVERLWDALLEQREEWSPIPAERWNSSAFYHPDHARHGTINVEGGHFLEEDISLFDAPFFNMSSDEAAAMDPQQRLLLEVTYEGLENAGLSLNQVAGSRTSCFVGSFSADYTDLLLRDPEAVPMYQCTNAGQSRAMTANRISYFYDLKGPSMTVDTACSGSLVALHLACQSLQTGEATMAIAAGVNVILSHEFMSTMSMMRFLSPDGRCHTFDEKANGYARGEAIGCVLLKPLDQALRDGNTIRAIIRGTGSNQDGRTPGITLPSGAAQEALIRDVYDRCGLCPSQTDVVEAHGTGTQAGDPLETGAISRVFGPGHSTDKPVYIGSIKTNVGHLEGTSGVAGVIKAVLMLENQTILPSRNLDTPNPRIPLEEWKLKVPRYPEGWNNPGPRRVSVNSFGYGGSNAHAILEEASGYLSSRGLAKWHKQPSKASWRKRIGNETSAVASTPRQRVFLLSGFDEYSCKAQANYLYGYLSKNESVIDNTFLDDVASTLSEGRSQFMWKTALTGSSVQDLAKSLSTEIKPRMSLKRPTLAFIFTGQGAQWAGMGKELLDAYPIFCESVSRIDRYLAKMGAPFKVSDEISKSPQESQLNYPLLSQTVCSALQIALVDLLRSWKVYSDSVMGHSSGEIAAAYASGALSVEDAMKVAYYRGLYASKNLATNDVRGSMIAIGVSAEAIEPYISSLISGKAHLACINSPSSVTVSGDTEAIAELADKLKDTSIFYRRLAVEVAYHSHHMELVADEYLNAIATIAPREQRVIAEETCQPFAVSMFSSVTGKSILPEELGPQYWVSNLLQQVKFSDSLEALCFETNSWHHRTGLLNGRRRKRIGSAQKASVDCLIEIGPHSALSGPVKQILQSNVKLSTADISYISILTRNRDAVKSALSGAATLVSMNYPLNLNAVNFAKGKGTQRGPRLLVDMPPYCWNHTRSYWAEPRLSKAFRNRSRPRTDLLGTVDNIACPFEPRWRNFIRVSEIPWIADHRIQSDIVFPAAGYLCMATEAATQVSRYPQNISVVIMRNVSIHSALIVTEASEVEVMTSLTPHGEHPMHDQQECYRFHIYSVSRENKWTEHCSGNINVESQPNEPEDVAIQYSDSSNFLPITSKPQGIRVVNVDRLYGRLQKAGLDYGPYFANLTSAHATETGTCFAEITIPDTATAMPMNLQYPLPIHPCTLDSVFHTIFAALPEDMGVEKGPIIPVSLDYMRLFYSMTSLPGERLSVCTDVRPGSQGQIVASIVVAENDSKVCSLNPKISINGLRGTRLEAAPKMNESSSNFPIAYGVEWQADPAFITRGQLSLFHQKNGKFRKGLTLRDEYDYYVTVLIQNAVKAFKEEHSRKPDLIYDKYKSSLSDMLRAHAIDENKSLDQIILTREPPSSPMGRLIGMIDTYLSSLSQIEDESFTQLHEELSNAYHEVLTKDKAYIAALNHVKLIGFKNPDMSILHLCDGTGRPLTAFLEALLTEISSEESAFPPFLRYTFTYTDKEDHERLKIYMDKWTKWIDFVKLADTRGISDSSAPGSENSSYDLIIVPNVFYSFHSSIEALQICRSMLKPSGTLIIVDLLRPEESILDNFLATALYLWPMGDFEPPRGLKDELDDAICKSGLTSNQDAASSDRQMDHVEGLIICQLERETKLIDREILVIQADGDSTSMAECLIYDLLGICRKVDTSCLAAANAMGKVCIVINDVHENVLASPDSETLSKLKDVFLNSSGILWISQGGAIDPTFPEYGLAAGFARTARSESAVKPIITLDLDAQNPLASKKAAKLIMTLFQRCFSQTNSGHMDTEYAERNGVVMIPRAIERSDINLDLDQINEKEIQCEQRFRQTEKSIRVSRPNGRNIHPYLAADFEMTTPLPTGYVRIEVMAVGLGEWDMQEDADEFQSRGTLGLECSGRVLAIGPGVYSLSIGDRVACLGAGTARSYYQDRDTSFQKISDSTTYEIAAAIPVDYTTAYFIMHYLIRAKPDELVLVQDATSMLGQAMLEMCCIRETGILATVTNPSQKELLLNRFAIPPERVFIESMDDIVMKILELTSGKKARAVISTAENRYGIYTELVKCVASFGHFVEISCHNDEREGDNTRSTTKNISFSSFNILDLQKDRTDLTRQIWPKVVQLFNEGKLHGPSSLSIYNISDLDQALSAIPTRKHVVVTAVDNDMIQLMRPKISKDIFQSDASYVLVGGLGGIGRAIALWMADKGAKNLILLNRSGLAKVSAQSTVQELTEKGVQVYIHACDISKESDVRQMFLDISWGAPPVRGIMHGAMVLKDIHIEKMTAEDYLEVLQPRYNGTWNLHRHAPTDLDFFLMLSSISGVIGNATQVAYAAGSAFMDSFAAYRNTLGLPATSLDLGTVTDVGYLAENEGLASKMIKQGFQGTDTHMLLSLVQVAIEQQRKNQTVSPGRSQIITGLGEWKEGQSLGNFEAPLFAHFRRRFRSYGATGIKKDGDAVQMVRDALRVSKTHDDALSIVFEALSARIVSQLGISVERIDPSSPLSDFGVDSHVAVELRNWINKTMESPVSILEILATDSVLHLASHIVSRSQLIEIRGDI